MTSCRSRSSSAEVHALELFVRFVAISGHARFRALDAAGLSFFASALEARLPLIGSSISFCPAAALRGFLPFAGSAPRSFAILRFRASIRSTTFLPFGRALAAMGLPLCFDRSIRSAQLRNDPQIFRARMWRFSDCASRAFTCSFSANVQATLFVPVPMLLSELIGRFQSAVYPAGVTRFHGVLNEPLRYVLAVRTFKRPQIGTVRTGLDPSRHQAALTFRTKRPFDRK